MNLWQSKEAKEVFQTQSCVIFQAHKAFYISGQKCPIRPLTNTCHGTHTSILTLKVKWKEYSTEIFRQGEQEFSVRENIKWRLQCSYILENLEWNLKNYISVQYVRRVLKLVVEASDVEGEDKGMRTELQEASHACVLCYVVTAHTWLVSILTSCTVLWTRFL
jgi:hypothetical protein